MRNLTMMTDLYQLTMVDAYIASGTENRRAVFDFFFRDTSEFNYALFAGLEQTAGYIRSLRFTSDDLDYLQGLNLFGKRTLEYLRDFRFQGTLKCVLEGTVVFPGEPIATVEAGLAEAQFLETALLNNLNHQTLIATKASRIHYASGFGKVMEFGLRRAQGADAGIYGARAAVIGGCESTSNVIAGKYFNVPVSGTQAHSFIMSYGSEVEAFRAYANANPANCLLLVDTYDTLKSGVPNAVTVFKELRAAGYTPKGIRLDSGDLAYLSKRARALLNDAGFSGVPICASGDLDEYSIRSLLSQGAQIDSWGVGTKLITSENTPSLGGVYKLSAVEENGRLEPRIKISENTAKITNPGQKELLRIYNADGMAEADLIALTGEAFDAGKPLTAVHPVERWKSTTFTNYTLKNLRRDIFRDGKLVYEFPTVAEIAAAAREDLNTFWAEYRRIDNPHIYKVDLSDGLYELKQRLLNAGSG